MPKKDKKPVETEPNLDQDPAEPEPTPAEPEPKPACDGRLDCLKSPGCKGGKLTKANPDIHGGRRLLICDKCGYNYGSGGLSVMEWDKYPGGMKG